MKYKAGAKVRLTSGGPTMTVDEYNPEGLVACTYWDGKVFRQHAFIESSLEEVSDEPLLGPSRA
jgi:uncharacterized protein YodC (DUF2158 family)